MAIEKELNLTLLNIGFIEPNEQWNWNDVCSPFARIYYVTAGTAKIKMGDKIFDLYPNKLYLIPPFTLHSNKSIGLFHHYYVHFHERTIRRESIFDKYNFPLEVPASRLHLDLMDRLLTINPERDLQNIDPQAYDNPHTISHYIADNTKLPLHSLIETQGILSQLIASFFMGASTKTRNKDSRIVKCLQYIHENIDQNLTIPILANIACVSEDHFIRLFKANLKRTPLQYINAKKMEHIQLLLISTDDSIQDIAHHLSIDNISYFNRLFKQHTGFTPSEYRKEYRDS